MLLGGNEWQPGANEADGWWLARAPRPTVTVITSAAQDIPDTQVAWAAAHFRELGATVEGCQIQSREDASDPRRLVQLSRSAAIYLCGGDPGAAQEVLVDTPAAAALRDAYQRGVPIAGSSAGAMVLSQFCLVPGKDFALRPGLGFFAAVVVPHWASAGQRWQDAARRLAQEHEVLAIDEATGAGWDGSAWVRQGPGRAFVLSGADELPLEERAPSPPVE
jgi:cyanophycinase